MRYACVGALLVAMTACAREPGALSPGEFVISGPFEHDNLAVFLLHRAGAPEGEEFLTLDEACAAGVLRISEHPGEGTVDTLQVENTGDRPVFLQAGETLKGGKQDRTIAADVILPPRAGAQPLSVFCVEPGRWSMMATTTADADFRASDRDTPFATKEQRLALRLENDQSHVWRANERGNLSLSNECGNLVQDSFVLTVEDPAVQARVREFVGALVGRTHGREDVVGMAFAVNGKMDSAEIYTTRRLFRKQWPKLLRVAAVAALARRSQPREGPATAGEVRALLVESAKGMERARTTALGTESFTRVNGKYVRFDTLRSGIAFRTSCTKMD